MEIEKVIKGLQEPLDIKNLDWRPQSVLKTGTGAGMIVLGYKDARVDMTRLDHVTGGAWSSSYVRDSKGVLQASISIYAKLPDGTWQWIKKTSNGIESKSDKEKGEYSDAFKRAGFMWGIGRELYELPFIWINLNEDEYYTKGDEIKTKIRINDWLWKYEGDLLTCYDKNSNKRFQERKAEKSKAAAKKKPVLKPEDNEKWSQAIAYIQNGNAVESVKEKYSLSKENEAKLKEQSNGTK